MQSVSHGCYISPVVSRPCNEITISPSYIVTSRHEPHSPFWLGNSGANRCPQDPLTILTHFTSLRHNPLSFRTSSDSVVPGQDRTHNLWFTRKRLYWGGYQCKIHGLKGIASSGTLACISMGYVVRLTRMLQLLHRHCLQCFSVAATPITVIALATPQR
jgi:hypothetical protein